MRCERVQEELMLNIGVEALSPEVLEHVGQCAECRAVKDDLDRVLPNALSDQAFSLSDQVLREIQEKVEKSIAPQRIFSVQRALAIAASVVLVVGVSYVGFRSGGIDDPFNLPPDSSADTFVQTFDWLESDADSPSMDALFESVDSDPYRSSYDLLLEEITDEELEYLENNLSAGELL